MAYCLVQLTSALSYRTSSLSEPIKEDIYFQNFWDTGQFEYRQVKIRGINADIHAILSFKIHYWHLLHFVLIGSLVSTGLKPKRLMPKLSSLNGRILVS